MTEALRRAARADARAEELREKRRAELRELIKRASEDGMRPSRIVAAIERRYTDAHVSRIIHGKA